MVDRGRLDYCKDLSFVDPRIRSHAPSDLMELLSPDYEPGSWDVICQGGRESYDHIGNRRFRVCIDNNLKSYVDSKSKHEKSMVVTVIVDAVRESSTQRNGGFIRIDLVTARWYEVGDKIAREKVGHALRDAIKLRAKQSKKENDSEPEAAPKPAKRRRTEESTTTTIKVSDCKKEESAKPEAEVPSCSQVQQPKPIAKSVEKSEKPLSVPKPIAVSATEDSGKPASIDDVSLVSKKTNDEWEKSLKESAVLFTGSNRLSLSDGEDSDDEEGSKSGDSVLNSMALQTSANDDDTEKAYQASIREMQVTADDPMLPVENFDSNLPAATAPKPKFERKPPGDSKMEEEFEAIMTSFAPMPIDSSVAKTMAGSKPKFQWKPPGDSKVEDSYKAFFRQVQGSLGSESAQRFMNRMKIATCSFAPHVGTSGMTPPLQTLPIGNFMGPGGQQGNSLHKIGRIFDPFDDQAFGSTEPWQNMPNLLPPPRDLTGASLSNPIISDDDSGGPAIIDDTF